MCYSGQSFNNNNEPQVFFFEFFRSSVIIYVSNLKSHQILLTKTRHFLVSSLLTICKVLATHFISENNCTVIEVLYSDACTEGLYIGHFMSRWSWRLQFLKRWWWFPHSASLLVGIVCEAVYFLTLASSFSVQYSHIALYLFTKNCQTAQLELINWGRMPITSYRHPCCLMLSVFHYLCISTGSPATEKPSK